MPMSCVVWFFFIITSGKKLSVFSDVFTRKRKTVCCFFIIAHFELNVLYLL